MLLFASLNFKGRAAFGAFVGGKKKKGWIPEGASVKVSAAAI